MAGVVRTRAGYAGGSKKNPTYYDLGDHTESIQIEYDPEQVSFAQLLEIFWNSHDPTYRSWKRQYATIAFYHNEEQRQAIEQSRRRLEEKLGKRIHTEVKDASSFYVAEDYHQKYYLRNRPELMREFDRFYPDDEDFVNSTAAARVNGYVGGYGDPANLAREIESYGLSPEGNEALKAIARMRKRYC